ncbi:hypothetical protein BU17DRAFT_80923 [Hysterangium stoloniferum]|nr:hypothetical protein BU17DRAFT_80923 [Hysterangium stoloniferum]
MWKSFFPSRNEDDEESSVNLPNPSYFNDMQVTTRTPNGNIMQTSNNNVLGNFPSIGMRDPTVPFSTPFLTTMFDTAAPQVAIEQLASSHTGYDTSDRGMNDAGWIYDLPGAAEVRASNRLPSAGHEQYYPGDHVIDPHLVGASPSSLIRLPIYPSASNPCNVINFNVPSTPANVANNLEIARQNHTIQPISDVCPTPQHHARALDELGRRECSCYLRVKFRANKVHTAKRFRCVQCNVAFASKKNANRHVKSSNNPVECFRCGRTFSRTDYVKKHQKASCAAQQ